MAANIAQSEAPDSFKVILQIQGKSVYAVEIRFVGIASALFCSLLTKNAADISF